MFKRILYMFFAVAVAFSAVVLPMGLDGPVTASAEDWVYPETEYNHIVILSGFSSYGSNYDGYTSDCLIVLSVVQSSPDPYGYANPPSHGHVLIASGNPSDSTGWRYITDRDVLIYQVGFPYGIYLNITTSDNVGGAYSVDIYYYSVGSAYVFVNNAYDIGYADGETEGWNNGWDDGYTVGEDHGHYSGYNEGYDVGFREGAVGDFTSVYGQGYDAGVVDGYNTGYLAGNTAGYNTGVEDGYNSGYAAANATVTLDSASYSHGYDVGYSYGYYEGTVDGWDEAQTTVTESSASYESGYQQGVTESSEYTFFGLLSAVIDVPIRAFTGLFNFEVLGVNLAPFFTALLTIALVCAVLKLVF